MQTINPIGSTIKQKISDTTITSVFSDIFFQKYYANITLIELVFTFHCNTY